MKIKVKLECWDCDLVLEKYIKESDLKRYPTNRATGNRLFVCKDCGEEDQ